MNPVPNQPTPTPQNDEGFSLIELMVALVVTGIIMGAMFGLLTGGQNAFRREPELADRQQAIRISMDRIQRDIQSAGASMNAFSQIFTDGLDGAGLPFSPGPNPAAPPDILEFLAHTGECPDIETGSPPTKGANVNLVGDVPPCYRSPGPVFVEYANGATKPGWAHKITIGGSGMNFPLGQQGNLDYSEFLNPTGAPGTADLECGDPVTSKTSGCINQNVLVTKIKSLDVVRYQIGPDADGMPSLWRSGIGGFDDNAVVDPTSANAALAGWRLIARGIEDLQVQYFTTTGGWSDNAGTVDFTQPNPDIGTIVERVKITLLARTTATNVAGATTSVAGVDAVRGELTTVMVPRAALHNISKEAGLWH